MNHILFVIIFFISMNTFSQQSVPTSLNDVSYLYPLPTDLTKNNLIAAAGVLDQKLLQRLPRLSMRYTNAELLPKIYAVAIRIDPFQKQIRTVWQPLATDSIKTTTTLDMAFHSFHQLDEFEFYNLFQKLILWKNGYSNFASFDQLPLQIHPILAQQNTAIATLNDIFKPYMTGEKLVKITAMVLRGNDDMWAFMGLEKISGVMKPIIIPRTSQQQVQAFINPAIPFDHFDQAEISGVTPEIEDNLNSFLKKASANPTLTEVEIIQTLNSVSKIENPHITSENQMDCVHCHIANTSKDFISKNYPQIFQSYQSGFGYKNVNFNLENKTAEKLNTRQIRGFGYFGRKIAISQRVINDSADIVSRWPLPSSQK